MPDSHESQDHHHHHHHEHGQPPLHGHPDDDAFTEANRTHWNDFASRYTSEQWQRELLNKVNSFIYQQINWIGVDFLDPSTAFEKPSPGPGRKVRVLDYACGPGSITHALGSRATEYVGIDLSENMVKAYNLRFNPVPDAATRDPSPDADGIYDSNDETLTAHAVVGNLLDSKEPSPSHLAASEYFDFDLVVVGLGFHHFADIPLATSRLVERLRPGGVFLILDFVTHAMDENPKSIKDTYGHGEADLPARHTVAHAGFSEAELKECFEGAGLTDFGIVRMDEDVWLKGQWKRRPFLARGRKT